MQLRVDMQLRLLPDEHEPMVLLLSILVRVIALVASVLLLRRIRDWRMGFLTAMLAFMTLRQLLTLRRAVGSGTWSMAWQESSSDELPGLLVSVLAGLAVVFLGRILREQRETYEALRKTEASMLQSQKMDALGQLAGRTAHDFNNLLTIIIGNTDLVRSKITGDDEAHAALTELESAAQRGADLSGKILSFSRKQVFEPRVIDVNGLVLGLDGMLRPLLGSDIEYVVFTSAEPALVFADPGQLDTAVINLAVNARDAMPRGGKLTIEVRTQDGPPTPADAIPDDGSVSIVVRDTGEGMDPAARSRAFEPFFTTKPEGKGTGLGLSICLGIVQRAGGDIELTSSSSQGTEFRVVLPRLVGEEPLVQAALAPALQSSGTERILVVEDEHQLRKLETRALRSRGYTVLEAANGAEALRTLESEEAPIALLVTDVVMPLVGGLELARRVRQRLPDLPILFTSGYLPDVDVSDLAGGGTTNFLQKPYNPTEFADMVRAILDHRSFERERR